MKVTHVLKDGTRVKDIRNHIVRAEDAGTVYRLIETINAGRIKTAEEVKEK